MGIGLQAKAFIVFFSAFVPCVINAYTGIKQSSPVLINVAKPAEPPILRCSARLEFRLP